MQTKITTENYEEVMFKLLENEYSLEEREEILFDIERNPFFAFEWKQFQKSIFTEDITPYEIKEVEFWKSLHQKEETKVFLLAPYYKNLFRIAASILLLISIYILIPNKYNDIIISNKVEKLNTIEPTLKGEVKNLTKELASEIKTKNSIQENSFDSSKLLSVQIFKDENIKDSNLYNNVPVLALEKPKEKEEIIKPLVKRMAYKVSVSTESISIEDFALLEDYDIENINNNDEKRIENYLKEKKTSLASLLKNTKLIFKKKDNKLYLLAYGENNSSVVWEIKN